MALDLQLSTPAKFAAALAHLERLSALWMTQVIAEGITEPGAVLARMVELDNARLEAAIADLDAAHRDPKSYAGERGLAMTDYIASSVYEKCQANPEPVTYSARFEAYAAEHGLTAPEMMRRLADGTIKAVPFVIWKPRS
jgi:hypothetical protein